MINDTIEKFILVCVYDWDKPEFFHHVNGVYTGCPKNIKSICEDSQEYKVIAMIKLTTCAETGNILSVELVNKEIEDANQ